MLRSPTHSSLRFTFEDEEGDTCSVSTEHELRHAIASFRPPPILTYGDGKGGGGAVRAATHLKLEPVVLPGGGGGGHGQAKKKKSIDPTDPKAKCSSLEGEEAGFETGGTGTNISELE